MIEQFYLTYRWDLNWFYQSGSGWLENNGNEGYFTFSTALGVEPHHQIQLSVIPRRCHVRLHME